MRYSLLPALILLAFLQSCKKNQDCRNSMTLTATTLTPTVGDKLVITALKESDNDLYQWSGPAGNATTQSATFTIENIKLSQTGVYTCSKSNSDCNTSLVDTILINVQLKKEVPPCTTVNNAIVCSNIPGVTLTSVYHEFDVSFNTMSLKANGGFSYPTFKVFFNSFNGNKEPLDGTHITSDRPTFDIMQEPNDVSVSFIYASNYYHCRPSQKVFVTHVNGKLQVSFCNMVFESGGLPNTTCTGKMTEL